MHIGLPTKINYHFRYNGSFEHSKHMFKLMDKTIFEIRPRKLLIVTHLVIGTSKNEKILPARIYNVATLVHHSRFEFRPLLVYAPR